MQQFLRAWYTADTATVYAAAAPNVVDVGFLRHLQASLAIAALKMAIKQRKPKPGSVIHHSDQGTQYACSGYTEVLADHDINPRPKDSAPRPGRIEKQVSHLDAPGGADQHDDDHDRRAVRGPAARVVRLRAARATGARGESWKGSASAPPAAVSRPARNWERACASSPRTMKRHKGFSPPSR